MPSARSRSSVSNSLSASCGVSTEVGSSRMMSCGVLQQAADDLDALALADRKVADERVRVERQAVAVATSALALAAIVPIGVSSASESAMFSATVSASNSEKCWNTMPMPSFLRGTRTGDRDRLAVPEDLAGSRARASRTASSPASTCRRRSRRASAWISPLAMVRSIWSQAVSVPKTFVRPRTSSRFGPSAAGVALTMPPIVVCFFVPAAS